MCFEQYRCLCSYISFVLALLLTSNKQKIFYFLWEFTAYILLLLITQTFAPSVTYSSIEFIIRLANMDNFSFFFEQSHYSVPVTYLCPIASVYEESGDIFFVQMYLCVCVFVYLWWLLFQVSVHFVFCLLHWLSSFLSYEHFYYIWHNLAMATFEHMSFIWNM